MLPVNTVHEAWAVCTVGCGYRMSASRTWRWSFSTSSETRTLWRPQTFLVVEDASSLHFTELQWESEGPGQNVRLQRATSSAPVFLSHLRETDIQSGKFWPQILQVCCKDLGQMLSLHLQGAYLCPQSHLAEDRDPCSQSHRSVTTSRTSNSDSKIAICIRVQDIVSWGQKFYSVSHWMWPSPVLEIHQ